MNTNESKFYGVSQVMFKLNVNVRWIKKMKMMMLDIEIDDTRHWNWLWWPGQADLKRTFPWLNIEAGDVSPEVLTLLSYLQLKRWEGWFLFEMVGIIIMVRKAPNLSVAQVNHIRGQPTSYSSKQSPTASVKVRSYWADKAWHAASSLILFNYFVECDW